MRRRRSIPESPTRELEQVETQIRLTDATDSVQRLVTAVSACRREIINLGVLHGLTTSDLARITGLGLNEVRAIARSGSSARP